MTTINTYHLAWVFWGIFTAGYIIGVCVANYHKENRPPKV